MICTLQVLSSITHLILDLVFVIGTSLQVNPFATLPRFAIPSVPRVLLNKDPVDLFDRMNDISLIGDCDDSILELCRKLGWDEDLQKLHTEIGGIVKKENPAPEKSGTPEPGKNEENTLEQKLAELTLESGLKQE